MQEKLNEALNFISDRHITEAAGAKRKRRFWPGAAAAVLAAALLAYAVFSPARVSAEAVSLAAESRSAELSYEERAAQEAQASEANRTLRGFFAETTRAYVAAADEENRVFSPVNSALALAMLAETVSGNSRQQILDALGAADTDTLRTQADALWEEICYDSGKEISRLAASVWLDETLDYDQDVMDTLASVYHASVYRADLTSRKSVRSLAAWLNENTGGLLKEQSDGASFPENAVLSLVATVYLQAKWSDAFLASNNTEDVFHAPDGDITCTFMHQAELSTGYCQGENFCAVSMSLKNNCRMWFFLPDEDSTVSDVLAGTEYLEVVAGESENQTGMCVNLSVPKFDITSDGELTELFQSLGVTDVFASESAGFTAVTSDVPVYVSSVQQAARVVIDEDGVKAASYVQINAAATSEAPMDETVDLVLDRPFVFVIATASGIPLFTGVVSCP